MYIIKILLQLLLYTTIIVLIKISFVNTNIINDYDKQQQQCKSREYNSKLSNLDVYWINLERSVDRRHFMVQQVVVIIIIISVSVILNLIIFNFILLYNYLLFLQIISYNH